MKMAKASKEDMEMALKLCSALEAMDHRFFPDGAEGDNDPEDFDCDDDARGTLFRDCLRTNSAGTGAGPTAATGATAGGGAGGAALTHNVGIDWHCKDAPATGTKLYSAPPKREFIGLTDEEIAKAWSQSKGDIFMRLKPFARAIESWTPLFDADVNLGDVIIAPAGDPTKVWLGSSKYPGEGGTFSKAEVNTILKRFYDENL